MAKVVYIKTFGCALNQSDSEVMAGLLETAGYKVINNYTLDEDYSSDSVDLIPDVVIINTCTVKNLAESKFFKELRKWQSRNIKVIAAGCIAQAEKTLLLDKLKDISVIGTRQLLSIVSVVNDTLDGEVVHNIDYALPNERLNLPKIRRNSIVEILPISEGCVGSCSYCKTKFARGNLFSYAKENILTQFKLAIVQGCKEIWITSQDNGCYGFDIYRREKYYLPQLLADLLAVEGDFKIRLGMCNPDHISFIKEDLIEVFKHPKMFKFLHIPIQSANNRVLKSMNRNYTVEKFIDIVDSFRREIPLITLSTDIIVGFPEESEEEFMGSLNLVTKVEFNVLNVSRFWLRSGTMAENMIQLPASVIKDRLIRIKNVFEIMAQEKNKLWLNKEFIILIDEIGKNGSLIGRDEYYRQIVIKNPSINLRSTGLGSIVTVKIVNTTKYLLIGEEIV